ncbi:MAG: acetylglutamate kinase [Gemmataceae bacterium]|nr:acetylglutamate kinase [Gemmata sp.]MDW8199088.1 acetylglutamate kinase [Gemmataceae bacterium]
MAEHTFSLAAFVAAVDRAVSHRHHRVVVKLGGSAMEDPAATLACLDALATLYKLGIPLVLVHGGGKPIDRAMTQAGLVPRKVAGRRYTDAATLEIVVRVLKDEINAELVAQLQARHVPAVATCDALTGERWMLPTPDGPPLDLGYVGRIAQVDTSLLKRLMADGSVPVIPSIARDAEGQWLNVNADTVAAAVAGALQADQTIFLTDTPGVLHDRTNPHSLMPALAEAQARELIARGVIDGGMIPKVEACLEALAAGARSAFILDGRVPYSLLAVFVHDTFPGTVIRR